MGANYNNFQSAEKPNAYSAKIKIIFCEGPGSQKNDDYAHCAGIIPIYYLGTPIQRSACAMQCMSTACLLFSNGVRKCC